ANWTAIAAGTTHSVALKSDGTLWAWGTGIQLGTGLLGYRADPGQVALSGRIARVRADFDGDGRSDVLWRNASTGENYLYFMNGTTILGSEGYLRTVADLNW